MLMLYVFLVPNGCLEETPASYQMLVHIFGAKSSPSCANFCLRQTTLDFAHLYDPTILEIVLNNFYMDDCLFSVSSVEEAISAQRSLCVLLGRRGFHLKKWLLNKKQRQRKLNLESFASIFWCRWTKEFLSNLSRRRKWFQKTRNSKLNDIVLIVKDMQQRSKWVLSRVVEAFPDKSGVVRTASVKTPSSLITRPITKLCLILEFDKETGNKLE